MYTTRATRHGLRLFRHVSWTRCLTNEGSPLPRLHRKSPGAGRNAEIFRSAPFLQVSRRTFVTEALPSVLLPPVVFTALLVGLWIYKCIMLVLFQGKIIYMPYMPPFARSEKLQDYAQSCRPVTWKEESIKSLDGTKLALCIGQIPANVKALRREKYVIICYFQGNGSSCPPRLPLLSSVLKSIGAQPADSAVAVQYVMVALSYRGYWHSSGRPSQRGIELDAQAVLQWVSATYGGVASNLELVLWGQSVGAGVASTAAANYLTKSRQRGHLHIAGLILETPFCGIRSMLLALYPQKWLPYRYLGPFLRSHWDSETALRQIAEAQHRPVVLLLPASRDEVVPPEEADKLEEVSRGLGLDTERKDVLGALHTEATTRKDGQEAVATFILRITSGDPDGSLTQNTLAIGRI